MSQQQTVLRVQTGIDAGLLPVYDFLDLYTDIPIKINKSFAELQDIAKKNTDYTIGLTVPGSKKNNRFFENFYNVDTQSLYFNANNRNNCDVLLGDEPLFRGYLKLNKVSVLNSKIEYDITLYSTVSNLFGQIGNNLLKDLNFNDDEYHFNHVFNLGNVTSNFTTSNFSIDGEKPYPYLYPVVHNGYEYDSGGTVNVSGTTLTQTRKYTSTSPISSYASTAAAWADGVKQYQINSPTQGLINNQLKPALNVYSLIQLIFKTYGYKIKSDFFNSPWMKSLYLYGYYSSENTKFSYKINTIQEFPPEGCEIVLFEDAGYAYIIVCKLGTGIPSYCSTDISFTLQANDTTYNQTIIAGTTGSTIDLGGGYVLTDPTSPTVATGYSLKYFPVPVGTTLSFEDGFPVDFSTVIDINIKQIDLLASISKKFNLVFISNPDNPNEIQIEPYDFYVGTGNVYDWTDKISYDKGWAVEPALNYLESDLIITDLDDNDEGNKQFKQRNNRIYGQQFYYGPTSFKSQEKKIETIFGPELIRKWDDVNTNNIGLPLGINYVANNEPTTDGNVEWFYKGVKTKPKLFFWLGGFNPFLDEVGETYPQNAYSTYSVYVSDSAASSYFQSDKLPVISHTMPMGLADNDKITNDSLSILFNSEQVTNIEGAIQTYNTYTENDAFSKFYNNRITNIYNPNTRFLTGFFNLKYSDVKNLKANDVIKIQEQYFTWNKISEFNLTQRELTKVELIQLNVNPQVYPDRYFQYFYCDNPSQIYKFKVDFTNPNLLDTNYGWSVYYDHQVGSLTGQTSGFTSTFIDIQSNTPKYVPYTMFEVSGSTYDSSGIDWTYDSLKEYIYSNNGAFNSFYMPTYWTNSGTTRTGVNVFRDCTDFNTVKNTWGILTGSSTYHGTLSTPTPVPTTTPTPTPTPQRMVGSLIVNYNEFLKGRGGDSFQIDVNGITRDLHSTDIQGYDSTYLYEGDTIDIGLFSTALRDFYIEVYRKDYTTDDVDGNNGIVETYITGTTCYSTFSCTLSGLVVPTLPLDYNFEYILNLRSASGPTPTPTPLPIVETCFYNQRSGHVIDMARDANGYIYYIGDVINPNVELGVGIYKTDLNGQNDPTFGGFFTPRFLQPQGPQHIVYDASSDKLIIGGDSYFMYKDIEYPSGLIRITTNGTIDATFIPPVPSVPIGKSITALAVQSDGKVLYSSNDILTVRRLNVDGSIDTGFTYTSISLAADRIAIQSDGKILVGYINTPGMYRLNSNGTLDGTFSCTSLNGEKANDIVIQPDGKILVARQSQPGLIRLNSNGSEDTGFTANFAYGPYPVGVKGQNYTIGLQSTGKIVIGGNFSFFNTNNDFTAYKVMRLNSDGSYDSTFAVKAGVAGIADNGFYPGPYQPQELRPHVDKIIVLPNDKLIMGGLFNKYNAIMVDTVVKTFADGQEYMCPDPNPTPTPTPTAVPGPTFAVQTNYAYTGNVLNTKTVTLEISVDTYYSGYTEGLSDVVLTGATNSITGQTINKNWATHDAATIFVKRTFCRTGSSQTRNGFIANLYINNVLQDTFNSASTGTLLSCPNNTINTISFDNSGAGYTINQNDVVKVVWTDNLS